MALVGWEQVSEATASYHLGDQEHQIKRTEVLALSQLQGRTFLVGKGQTLRHGEQMGFLSESALPWGKEAKAELSTGRRLLQVFIQEGFYHKILLEEHPKVTT